MKKKLFLLITLLFALVSAYQEALKQDGVLVLNEENFDEEISHHDFLLVLFYTPWCDHCNDMASDYARAAQKLAQHDPPYYIAKVDVSENKQLVERFTLRNYPTLTFFKKGVQLEYSGGRSESDIVNWILKKVGPASTEINCEGIDEKKVTNFLTMIYFGDTNTREFKQVYLELASHHAVALKFAFYHSHDKDCAAKNGVTQFPKLVMFRDLDRSPDYKQFIYEGPWEINQIIDFMIANSIPNVIDFHEDYIELIFGEKRPAILLFKNYGDNDHSYFKVFSEAAEKLKGEILFVISDATKGIQKRFAEFVGIEPHEMPALRIVDPQDNMRKYHYPHKLEELTFDSLFSFISDFKNKSLHPFLKSQDIPAVNNGDVRIIVGKNFQKEVMYNDQDVFIEFYAPWCSYCKKLQPIWDQLGQDLKNIPGLVIAKMDVTQNEVEDLEIKNYPTIRLYPKGKKQSPIDYEGSNEIEEIKEWLSHNSKACSSYIQGKISEKDL